MPILLDSEDIYNKDSEILSLNLDLLKLEIFSNQTTEGWINYTLDLRRGKQDIVQTKGTLHDDDLRSLEEILLDLPNILYEFEPLEPDFILRFEPISDKDAWALSCNVNYGKTLSQYYGTSTIGMTLLITKTSAKKFANDLRLKRINITNDETFTGFETKPVTSA